MHIKFSCFKIESMMQDKMIHNCDITECWGLEGNLKDHLLQSPHQSRKKKNHLKLIFKYSILLDTLIPLETFETLQEHNWSTCGSTLLKNVTTASKAGLGDPTNHAGSSCLTSVCLLSLWSQKSPDACSHLDPQTHPQAWDWCNLKWFKPGSSPVWYVTGMILKTSHFHFVLELFAIS